MQLTPGCCVSVCLQCVVAAQLALCLKAAMRPAVVCVNQSFRVPDVNSVNLDSTPTPTVKVCTQKAEDHMRPNTHGHTSLYTPSYEVLYCLVRLYCGFTFSL